MKAYRLKELAEAEKFFSEVVNIDDDLLNAKLMLCKINYYNGNLKSAIEYADSVLDTDPDHIGAMYWKARALLLTDGNNMAEPADLLVRLLETDSHNIQARLLLGMIYEKESRNRDALHQYLAVIEEEEGIISARGNLALLYGRMGLVDKSRQELRAAKKIAALSGKGEDRLNLICKEMEDKE